MNRIKMTLVALFACVAAGAASAQYSVDGPRMTRQQYIEQFKQLAIEHMEIYGIPASIKMAQALHESDNGNSRLAREANNHFGIKCKSNWTGETITHTDDAPDECFRKYASAEDSWRDHSEFLDNSPRYQDLFKLDPKDYKGWAYGLMKAGYATNPRYAEALIKIIEDNQLYLLDEGQPLPTLAENTPEETVKPVEVEESRDKIDVDNYRISSMTSKNGRPIYHNNQSQFVMAVPGDTYETIAAEFGMSAKKLRKYNDVYPAAAVAPGEMVYIKAKARRATNGKMIHVARPGDTMHSIAQQYGIRLKSLLKINHRSLDSRITEGQQIRLM